LKENRIYSHRIELVPEMEREDVFEVHSQEQPVKVGQWARIVRGLYRGDLCIVKAYDTSAQKVVVRVLPRLDIQAMIEGGDVERDDAPIAKKGQRPMQKLLTLEQARLIALGNPAVKEPAERKIDGQDYYIFAGNRQAASPSLFIHSLRCSVFRVPIDRKIALFLPDVNVVCSSYQDEGWLRVGEYECVGHSDEGCESHHR